MRSRFLTFVAAGLGVLGCGVVPWAVHLTRPGVSQSATARMFFYTGLVEGMALGVILAMMTFLPIQAVRASTKSRLLVLAAMLPGLLAVVAVLRVVYSDPVFSEVFPAGAG
jgi:hypothetical protein